MTDSAPPTASVKYDGAAFTGGCFSDVRKFTITLSDNLDTAPLLTSLKIGTTSLTTTKSGNVYTVTGPTSLSVGDYTNNLYVSTQDANGNSGTETIPVIVDKTGPTISNFKNSGSTFTGGRVTDVTKLSFSVVDAIDTTPTVSAKINGTAVTLSQSGSVFTVTGPTTLNSQQFSGNLEVTAIDDCESVRTEQVAVLVDNIGPTITIRNSGSTFAGGRILDVDNLSVVLSETISPNATLTSISLGGTPLTFTLTGAGQYTVTGPQSLDAAEVSSTSLTVTAKDALGNVATRSVTAFIDNLKPVISNLRNNTTPFSGGRVQNIGNLTFTVTDGVDANPNVTATLNGTPLTLTKSGTSYRVSGPSSINDLQFEGPLVISARDASGNIDTFEVESVIVDNTAPIISNLKNAGSPFAGGTVEDALQLSFAVEDLYDPNPTVTATLNGTPMTLTKSGQIYSLTGPADINQEEFSGNLVITAKDSFGNTSTSTTPVTLDKTAPVISNLRNNNVTFNGGQVRDIAKLTFTVTDGVDSAPTVTAAFGGQALTLSKTGTTYSITGPSSINSLELAGDLIITATDDHSNTAEKIALVLVDNTAPVTELRYDSQIPVANNRYTDLTLFTLSFTDGRDPSPELTQCQLVDKQTGTAHDLISSRSGNVVTITGPESLHDIEFSPGTLSLKVADDAGNEASVSLDFHLDNSAPRISGQYEGQPYTRGRITSLDQFEIVLEDASLPVSVGDLSITDDIGGGVTALTYTQASPALLQLQDMAGFNVADIGAGSMNIEVSDAWGNTGTATLKIINDFEPPEVRIELDGQPFTGGQVSHISDLKVYLEDEFDSAPTLTATLKDMRTGSTAAAQWQEDGSLLPPAGAVWETPGEILLTISACDIYDNCQDVTREIDNLGPMIKPYEGTEEFTDGKIEGFDQLEILLQDSFDAAAVIESATIVANNQVLPVKVVEAEQRLGAPTYGLIPPPLPASIDGSPYQLSITTKDKYGNTHVNTLDFEYSLRAASTFDGQPIKLPGVEHAFTRTDGRQALFSESLTTRARTRLTGQHDLKAYLSSDATVPLVVNGVQVSPGETVIVATGYDFDINDSRINLPIKPAAAEVEGTGRLLIQPQVLGAPTLVVNYNTWVVHADLSASTWEVEQIFGQWEVAVRAVGVANCDFSSNEATVAVSDIFRSPAALVTFTGVPAGMKQKRETPPTLSGRLYVPGEHSVSFKVELVDADGSKIQVAEGSKAVTVTPAREVSYAPSQDISSIYRRVSQIEFGLRQIEGPNLDLTTSISRAQEYHTFGALIGVLEWTTLPEGMEQDAYYDRPTIAGGIDALGDHMVGWRVFVVDEDGNQYDLATQEATINVINPPPPEVFLQSNNEVLADGSLAAPLDPVQIGLFSARAPRRAGNITLELTGVRGGTSSNIYSTGLSLASNSSSVTFSKMVELEDASLWDRNVVTMTAYYTDMPDVRVEQQLEVLRVPPARTSLALIAERESLDTEGVPYQISLGDLVALGELSYVPERHGNWDVQINKVAGISRDALTEKQALTGGHIDGVLEGLPAGSISLEAAATIVSPDGLYTRTLTSNRGYVSIYVGTAPDAEITSRYYSGKAPLMVVLGLTMDMANRVVLGDVIWEFSRDGGTTWETVPTGTVPTRLTMTFQEGIYQIRALAENIKTGEKGYTETIEIHAFNIPDLELSGSSTVFVGGEAVVTAKTSVDGVEVPAVVLWKDQAGEVLQEGQEFRVVPAAPTSYYLNAYARLPESPDDAPLAWALKRYLLQAKAVTPPRGMILIPRYMEAGAEYPIKAQVGLPYTGMSPEDYQIMGEWTLPDGTTATGSQINYVPTDADADAGVVTFKYTTWIDGFKDAGASATFERQVKVGRYVWPEFEILQSQSIAQAPCSVTMQVVPKDYRGALESPEYTWSLPDSATITNNYGSRIIARFMEPGTFDIQVHVKDARGQESTVVTQVVTAAAAPFEINATVTPSNEFYHAPLNLTIWPRVSGGHPQDRMSTFAYYLDDEPVEATGAAYIRNLQPGDYVVRIVGSSQLGEEAVQEIPITVKPNIPPECTLSQTLIDSPTNPQYLLEATCSDTDGVMAGYRWYVGEKIVGYANRIGFKVPVEGSVVVDFVGTDNTGGEYRSSITLLPKPTDP